MAVSRPRSSSYEPTGYPANRMKITPTPLPGVAELELEPHYDERGSFARAYDVDLLAREGLSFEVLHVNLSRNPHPHTLRGMHYQADPHPDAKIVRCVAGAIFDVALDLRLGSPSRTGWHGVALDATGGRALHLPAGCAHGFITLEPDTEVLYLMGERYYPELGRGARWDDPAFAIDWPATPRLISERDATYPDWRPE